MREIHRLDAVDSTMNYAAALAAAGRPSGTTVVAERQTAGQGRHGNAWHSEPGSGLYVSELLRHKICPDSLPLVMLALGLATAEAITQVASVLCDLRWPNDVLVNGKKVSGVLVQLHEGVLVLGIGINVNHRSFPKELEDTATSLYIATGREHDREALLEALLRSIDDHLEMLLKTGKDAVLKAFSRASSYVRGRRVTVDQGDKLIEGTTDGLDPQGFLYLRGANGVRTLILAGGVRPACS